MPGTMPAQRLNDGDNEDDDYDDYGDDLDARDDAGPPDEVNKGSPVLGLLVERLMEQNNLGEHKNGVLEVEYARDGQDRRIL